MNEFIVTHVKPGETLSEIAVRYGVSTEALQRWNRIENPDLVLAGQRIVVYNTAGSPDPSTSWSTIPKTVSDPLTADGSWIIWLGGAILLAILVLLFLRRKRNNFAPVSHFLSSYKRQECTSTGQNKTLKKPNISLVTDPLPRPQVNDGERLVSSELMRLYPDWILIDDVMLPSVSGTTQIDHILVSPSAIFLIETKEMSGWIFGRPRDQQWTQTFAASHRSRKAGKNSKPFPFYNPLRQNEGHAKVLLNLGVGSWRRLRPVVAFVGEAHLKTAENFLPFDMHEKIASKRKRWRMRGVVCMSLADLRSYMNFSANVSSSPDMTRDEMEAIRSKIRSSEIRKTAESLAGHIEYVQSIREKKSKQSKKYAPQEDITT